MSLPSFLVERKCPGCGGFDSEILFSLALDQFLFNNPTHEMAWFRSLEIPNDQQFPFVKCRRCGFVFTKFKLDDKHNFDFYNQGINVEASKEKVYKKKKRIFQLDIWTNLLQLSVDSAYYKVLDFGGGWGDFLSIAKSYGVDIFGLEFDERKIAFAKSQGVTLGDLQFIRDNAPYDIFMCNQVLEHLDDPKSALADLRSCIRTGAIGFIGVPNFNETRIGREIALIRLGSAPTKEINPFGHLNYFTPESFIKILTESNFEVIQHNIRKGSRLEKFFKRVFQVQRPKETMVYVKAT